MADEATKAANPYRPGQGVKPPYLGDRRAEIKAMQDAVSEGFPQNIAIYGLRGVGKTVLLREYREVALKARWVGVKREFSPRMTEEAVFAAALLSDLETATEELSSVAAITGTVKKALSLARDLIGGLRVKYEDVEFRYEAGKRTSPVGRVLEDDLLRAFQRVGDIARRQDRGVVLLYDEFQELCDSKSAGQFPLSALVASLGGIQQESLPVMLVACGLPPLIEHLAEAKSYTERMFEGHEIGALRPPEDRRALVNPARAVGRDYEDEAVEAVLEDTARYPFFIQFYGRELWGEADGATIKMSDFTKSKTKIQEKLDDYFYRSRYVRATPAQKALLGQIASFGENATIKQLLQVTKKSNASLQMLIRGLIESGLVYRPDRGEVAFSAPLFGRYVLRQPDQT